MCRLRKTRHFCWISTIWLCFLQASMLWFVGYMCVCVCFGGAFDCFESINLKGYHDTLEKLSKIYKSQKNACRMLHTLIEKSGVCLPLEISCAQISIRRMKPLGEYKAWWPFITMQTWVSFLLENFPHILLGGHTLEEVNGWQRLLYDFWRVYKDINPGHPVFSSDLDTRFLIPYVFHGDEGRGSSRVPFLVLSFQPFVSHKGMSECNDSSCLGPCHCVSTLSFLILMALWCTPVFFLEKHMQQGIHSLPGCC